MKTKIMVLVGILITQISFPQTGKDIKTKIDSLENVKDASVLVIIHNPFELSTEDSKKIDVQKGDRLELIGFAHSNFEVKYNSQICYAWEYNIYNNWLEMGNNLEEIKSIKTKLLLKTVEKKTQIHAQKEKERKRLSQKKAEERKKKIIEKYGNEDGGKILEGHVWIGMTKEMARESWGRPEKVNRTVNAYVVNEQWVYSNNYLYFENGILTSWQDSN